MSADKPRELPEFVDDLVRIGTAELVKQLAAPEEKARAVMACIADGIVNQYARSTMYVPAGFGSRNSVIWSKYQEPGEGKDGRPGARPYTSERIEELAVEYQLTTRQIRNILAVMRAAEMARTQPRLAGFED
jgi:Mor family transcriptional regulator